MQIDKRSTAVLFIDPQIDVLSPQGRNWSVVGDSVTENETVAHMTAIFQAAREHDVTVMISPHYFYPADHSWKFNGPLESAEFESGTFARTGPLRFPPKSGQGLCGLSSRDQ